MCMSFMANNDTDVLMPVPSPDEIQRENGVQALITIKTIRKQRIEELKHSLQDLLHQG